MTLIRTYAVLYVAVAVHGLRRCELLLFTCFFLLMFIVLVDRDTTSLRRMFCNLSIGVEQYCH